MKFQPRRFVVEVKRGTSRSAFASPDTLSDKFSNAEEMLFGGTSKAAVIETSSFHAASTAPARRILESLIEPPPAVIEDLPERPKRGRKPGSKNKPKLLPVEAGMALAPRAEVTLEPKRIDRSSIAERRGFAEDGASRWDSVIPAPLPPEAPLTAKAPTGSEAGETSLGARQGRVRLRDRSSIIKRYVLGTEPMPGQPGSLRARRLARAR